MQLRVNVNGVRHELDGVPPDESLMCVLRDRLSLTGTKNGCSEGRCGACTVVLDGVTVCSCLMAAGQVDGCTVETVEGLGQGDRPSELQGAFADAGAVQCGFCAPGMLVQASQLLLHTPTPSDARIREALAGNLCRCTGYEKILDAVRLASARSEARLPAHSAAPRSVPSARSVVGGGIGQRSRRPDAVPKATGQFAYASDLCADGMLVGCVVRSPHAYARIVSVDVSEALAIRGVHAVLTHADVAGANHFGVEFCDQPILAEDVVRYEGEAIALVAADDARTARYAASRVRVEYDPLDPVTDPTYALSPEASPLHPQGNLLLHRRLRIGESDRSADVVVTGEYHTAMQDPAFLDPEAGLALPDGAGGVELHVATQWLHGDQRQICAALGLPPEKVRLKLAGVGGAFGGREDISLHVHACMLALRTGRPVKITYTRAESFRGHPHRHPATMRYTHGFRKDGTLLYLEASIVLDGGAYASSTAELTALVAAMACGPYVVPNVSVDAYGVYTNNPPCGAMRGFGMVQVAFACEAQMDKAAAALSMDPLELRIRNAMHEGASVPTGQVLDSPAPVAELLRRLRNLPLPDGPGAADGQGNQDRHAKSACRGIGYAVGYKSVAFSEGFDDYSTARVRLEIVANEPRVTVHTAAAEVGQGITTVEAQICRTELGVDDVVVHPRDTSVGSAGPSSASRQTYVTGGAVRAACALIRARVLAIACQRTGQDELQLVGGKITTARGEPLLTLAETVREPIEETAEWRHRPTSQLDPVTGRGFAHVQYAFAAHRAIVEVDTELGTVTVVELASAQDVGKAINPQAVEGQIQGGTAQGLGLALMEEIRTERGCMANPSFAEYLIPTIVDMPPMIVDVLELPDPNSPYGLRGVGEPSAISSTPAVVAAIRAATGRQLTRVPVRRDDIVGISESRPSDQQ
jgi:xanthine dehydrogenase D subunit